MFQFHDTSASFFLPAEFQRQESIRSQHRGIQLYDTPYEPEGQSIDSDSESAASPRLRESKLPQDDDRPADEYDQPWEWNRVTIPALAGKEPVGLLRGGTDPRWTLVFGKGSQCAVPACSDKPRAALGHPVGLSLLLVQLSPSKMRVLEGREARPRGNPGSQFQSPQSSWKPQLISLSDPVSVLSVML